MTYQTRAPLASSYCHWSYSTPTTVAVDRVPFKRCCLSGLSTWVGSAVRRSNRSVQLLRCDAHKSVHPTSHDRSACWSVYSDFFVGRWTLRLDFAIGQGRWTRLMTGFSKGPTGLAPLAHARAEPRHAESESSNGRQVSRDSQVSASGPT